MIDIHIYFLNLSKYSSFIFNDVQDFERGLEILVSIADILLPNELHANFSHFKTALHTVAFKIMNYFDLASKKEQFLFKSDCSGVLRSLGMLNIE